MNATPFSLEMKEKSPALPVRKRTNRPAGIINNPGEYSPADRLMKLTSAVSTSKDLRMDA